MKKRWRDEVNVEEWRSQSLACLSLSWSILASLFLSGGDRYFCVSNFFSSSMVWSLENRTCPPFLLWSGRWMNGVHSSGLPAETRSRDNLLLSESRSVSSNIRCWSLWAGGLWQNIRQCVSCWLIWWTSVHWIHKHTETAIHALNFTVRKSFVNLTETFLWSFHCFLDQEFNSKRLTSSIKHI